VAAQEISGRVSADGRPLEGVDVLVFSEPARRLAGATRTDAEGGFRVTAEGEDPLVVLAKVRGEVCSPEVVSPVGSEPVDINVRTGEGFADLSGRTEDLAPPLVVRLDPVSIAGVPDWLIPLVAQRSAGVFEGSYCEAPATGGTFHVRLRRGEWRLRGDRFVDGPVGPGGTGPANLTVTAVSTDAGEDAEGDAYGGFRLVVQGDVGVRLGVGPGS
jgi:hypothetical protein